MAVEELVTSLRTVPTPIRNLYTPKGGDSRRRRPPPQTKEGTRARSQPRTNSRRGDDPQGWARTGLEPEVVVCLYMIPYDAILDTGATFSMIDHELCECLCLRVNSFKCDIPHCIGLEGVYMTKSITNVLGWVQVELGIPFMGCIFTRLWVTSTMHKQGVPLVLGSHVIKKFFAQANLEKIDCWPPPLRFMYERCANSKWYSERDSEDLYDSDDYATGEEDSFEILPEAEQDPGVSLTCSEVSMDSCLENLKDFELTWEEEVVRVEQKIKNSSCTALKGIPGPLKEPDKEDSSSFIANSGIPPPRIMEELQSQSGDETSVFVPLASGSESVAMKEEGSTCNSKVPAEAVGYTVKLPPYPTVSCRITPTGETLLNFQWGNK